MRHVEFIHIDHFEKNYHRVPPPSELAHFIDFFWETDFEHLWKQYPKGFSDAQFPNIGYTYILNLGTGFIMQVAEKRFALKTNGFLPRNHAIECFHKPGNHLFGIKFRISPVILEKKINFGEYKGYIYPLSYLMDKSIINKVKSSPPFENRIEILTGHFLGILRKYQGSLQPAHIVSNILEHCFQKNDFSISMEELAEKHKISARTLQRYFEICTGVSTKTAIQVMRIRKATAQLAHNPDQFDHELYGYYDHSHFCKHLKQFLYSGILPEKALYLKLLSHIEK